MTRFALLFPGQGSQAPGMGRELAEADPVCRELFEEADRALDFPISRICFEGSEEEQALTENTQPAILTASIAAWRALEQAGLKPAAAAGHSLGEYSANVAAGTMSFADAVRTVRSRGRFMQEAVPLGRGAMAAILGLDAAQVDELCRRCADNQVVSPANMNGPSQTVVAGDAAAVERVMHAATEAGAMRAVSLPVSAPFHCALMQPAADRLQPVLEQVPFADPGFEIFTNVDAAAVSVGDDARQALVRQVTAPVRWQELMEAMLDAGIETFVEVGPGKVLAGLARRIRKGTRVIGVSDPAGVAKAIEQLGGEA